MNITREWNKSFSFYEYNARTQFKDRPCIISPFKVWLYEYKESVSCLRHLKTRSDLNLLNSYVSTHEVAKKSANSVCSCHVLWKFYCTALCTLYSTLSVSCFFSADGNWRVGHKNQGLVPATAVETQIPGNNGVGGGVGGWKREDDTRTAATQNPRAMTQLMDFIPRAQRPNF